MLALLAAALLGLASPPPAPDAPLPSAPRAVAARLAATTRALDRSIEAWRRTGTARPPRETRLWALDQQRLYLALGLAPAARAEATLAALPPGVRADARPIVAARRALVRLTPPTRLPPLRLSDGPGRATRPAPPPLPGR